MRSGGSILTRAAWVLLAGVGLWCAFEAPAAVATAVPVGPWDPLAAWHRLELEWVARFQAVPGLEGLMRLLTQLGPSRVTAAVLAALWVAWDPRRTTRLLVLLLAVLWLRELLALAFESPRPFWYGAPIRAVSDMAVTRTTYSFPSGHALGGAALWLTAAAMVGRAWAWGVAVVVVAGIAVSRVYLGVHYPSDVVAGVGIGAACAWAFPRLESGWRGAWSSWDRTRRRGVVAALVAGGLLAGVGVRWAIGPVPGDAPPEWTPYFESARSWRNALRMAGTLLGMGWALAAWNSWPEVQGDVKQRCLRLTAVAAAGGALLWSVNAAGMALPRGTGDGWGSAALLLAVFAMAGWALFAVLPTRLERWGWWRRRSAD